jgi:hypothetical protein
LTRREASSLPTATVRLLMFFMLPPPLAAAIDAARRLNASPLPAVAKSGPCTCEAVFLNREEVELHHVYYDPVHDFAVRTFLAGGVV